MIILSSDNLDSHLLTSTNKCSHTSHNFLTKGPSLNSFTNTLGTNHFGIGRLLKAPILAFLMKVLEQAILGLPARFRRVLGRVLDDMLPSVFTDAMRSILGHNALLTALWWDETPCPVLSKDHFFATLSCSVGERTAGLGSWGVEVLLHGAWEELAPAAGGWTEISTSPSASSPALPKQLQPQKICYLQKPQFSKL